MNNKLFNLFARYFLIVLFGLGNLFVFYFLFTPLTVDGVGFVLSFFGSVVVVDGFIVFNDIIVSLIAPCVAGAAYYLLFILVFSVRDIKCFDRIKVLLYSFGLFYVFNVIRIILLVGVYGNSFFNLLHLIFWYLLSTIFVVLIWVFMIKKFTIGSIPVYDDLRFLFGLVKKGNRAKISAKRARKRLRNT